jgi:hypothetical protein
LEFEKRFLNFSINGFSSTEKENNRQKSLENSRKILLIDEQILKDIHILKLNILGCDNGRAASSCWQSTARVVARAGNGATFPCEEEPAGLGERRAGELGAMWRRKSGEGAAGGRGKHRRWAAGRAAEK